MTISINDNQHKSVTERHNAECGVLFIVKLNGIMMNGVMLSAIMLTVAMLNV